MQLLKFFHLFQNFQPIKLGNYEYVCPICSKIMTTYPNMKNHIRIHTGEKPYRCPNCEYGSNQKHNCERHILKVHGVTFKF